MKQLFLLSALFLFTKHYATAQGAKWEKEVPGKLIKATPSKIPGFKTNALFEIINRIPIVIHPKGFNVEESFRISTKEKIYTGGAFLQFWRYISYDKASHG